MKRFSLAFLALISYALSAQAQIVSNPFNPDIYWCSNIGAFAMRAPGAWGCLQPGTAGYVLQSNGPGVVPSWVALAGGGNVSNTGTPTNNQFAIWTNANTIKGMSGGNALMDLVTGFSGTSTGFVSRSSAGAYSLVPAVPVANGGTGATTASGTALDNISGFSGTGIVRRTGAGAYTQGGVVSVAEGGTGQTSGGAAAMDAILGVSSGAGTISRTGVNTYTIGGDVLAGPGNFIYFSHSTRTQAPSDGTYMLSNNVVTDFNRIMLGGSTNAFPSLQRSGASLRARLADDSADTNIIANDISITGSKTQNTFLAAPSGASGAPTWRAITSSDIAGLSAGGLISRNYYTATTTVTIPSGAHTAIVQLYGGNGASTTSGGCVSTAGVSGVISGGGGSYLEKYLTGLTPAKTLSLTVATAYPWNAVLASGTQSITTLTAGGGEDYHLVVTTPVAGAGGSASGGDINIPGSSGVRCTGYMGDNGSSAYPSPPVYGVSPFLGPAGVSAVSGGLIISWYP